MRLSGVCLPGQQWLLVQRVCKLVKPLRYMNGGSTSLFSLMKEIKVAD